MRRTGIARRTPLASSSSLPRTPLRRVSPQRAREQRAYASLRRDFLAARPWCEFPDCGKAATEVHHRRGRVGALYLDVTHWSALCSSDHAWITAHPSQAFAMGLSERRTGAA